MLRKVLFTAMLAAGQLSAQSYTQHEIWENDAWKNLYLYTIDHAMDGEPERHLTQFWDDAASAWVNEQQTLHTTPVPFIQENTLTQSWNIPTQTWSDVSRTTTLTTVTKATTKEIWNGTAWINAERDILVYGSPSYYATHEVWSGGQWVNVSKTNYTIYPDNGGRETIEQTWDGSAWQNQTRNDIIVNGMTMTETVDQVWENGQWQNVSRTVTEPGPGVPHTSMHFVWTDADWSLVGRTTHTGANGDSQTVYEAYDSVAQQYTPENQTIMETEGEYVITTFQNYNGEWINDYRLTDYLPGILENEKHQATVISVFPNPAENLVTVSASEPIAAYQLFGLDGKIIATGNPNGDVFSVDVSGLSRGVYLLKTGGTVSRIVKR